MLIRPYQHPHDEAAVIALWHACGLSRAWNNPRLDIERKLSTQAELFLVGITHGPAGGTLIASAMAGYDGHRGWVNYLAVSPDHQQLALGTAMMAEVERLLLLRGCPKVNLQVRSQNTAALAFYAKLGYAPDEVVSLGKRLITDAPVA